MALETREELREKAAEIVSFLRSEHEREWKKWINEVWGVRFYHAPQLSAARIEMLVGPGMARLRLKGRYWGRTDWYLEQHGFKLAEEVVKFLFGKQEVVKHSPDGRHYTEWRLVERR